MLDRTAIEKIEELTRKSVEPVSLNGVHYLPGKDDMYYPPSSETVHVMSLQSLVDIYPTLQNPDLLFHVQSPTRVSIVSSKLDAYRIRESFACADIDNHVKSAFKFDHEYTHEHFMIALQSGFIRTENLQKLIDIISKVSIGEEGTIEDDGITQTVSAKAGVVLSTKVALPNPVKLKAFKTFPEIDVPEEEFIFRVTKRSRDASFKLIQSKSMKWELETCEAIKTWISGKIAGVKVV